jgi:hypothetical protein
LIAAVAAFAQSGWIWYLKASFTVQISVMVVVGALLSRLIGRALRWIAKERQMPIMTTIVQTPSVTKVLSTARETAAPPIVTKSIASFSQTQNGFLPRQANVEVNCKPASTQPITIAKAATQLFDEVHIEKTLHDTSPNEAVRQRKVRKARVFVPEHFRRHSQVPGFLYLARNPFHQVGLHKLGYTTEDPDTRLNSLNDQHGKASDVGRFELIHSVPVSASYEAEQALFEVLSDARVVSKREFFFESQDFLTRGLDAAGYFSSASATAFNNFYEYSLDRDNWTKFRPIRLQQVSAAPLLHPEDGWFYIARNPWHRDNIYRVSCSKHNPSLRVEALNAAQRKLTSQIGFYALVHCIGSADVGGIWTGLNRRLSQYRVEGSRVFYEAQLTELVNLISEAVRQPIAASVPESQNRSSAGEIIIEKVCGRPSREWVAWTAPCPRCGAILRLKGTIGALEYLPCPVCEQALVCHLGPRGSTISAR